MPRTAKNAASVEADNIVKLLQDASKNAQDKATVIRQGRLLVTRMDALTKTFKTLLDELEGTKPQPPEALGEEAAAAPAKPRSKSKSKKKSVTAELVPTE